MRDLSVLSFLHAVITCYIFSGAVIHECVVQCARSEGRKQMEKEAIMDLNKPKSDQVFLPKDPCG